MVEEGCLGGFYISPFMCFTFLPSLLSGVFFQIVPQYRQHFTLHSPRIGGGLPTGDIYIFFGGVGLKKKVVTHLGSFERISRNS